MFDGATVGCPEGAGMADVQQSGGRGRQPSAIRLAMRGGTCIHALILEVRGHAMTGRRRERKGNAAAGTQYWAPNRPALAKTRLERGTLRIYNP